MTAYKQLEQIFARHYHLTHLQAIALWDESVMMPIGGGPSRADALATLATIMHENLTNPLIGELIKHAKDESLSTPWEKRNLKLIEKIFINKTCLPASLVNETTQAALQCEQAWRKMRAENNWKDFAPLLEKNIALVKQSAEIRADIFQKSPYDILIDDFSPDLTQAIIDPIFDTLRENLPGLIQVITKKQANETTLLPEGPFAIEKQRELGLAFMQALGFDFNHGRLDVSHHPFCGGVPEDVRMTTRYNEREFMTSMMGVCHETGHARYEQNLPKKWLSQPVGAALGMAIHESQSLLIEMQACRSKAFMQFASPIIKNQFGDQEAFDADNLFHLYTRVKPSYIRVEADEVTYPLHVILRYDIERELIEGDLTVHDLPERWDQKMQQYLGLSTKNNFKDGVMQDVHWPSGAFGYFPAYTFGSLIAAQLFSSAQKSTPDLLKQIEHGNFSPLFDWLSQHIHSRASSITLAELLKEATGEALDARYFLDHVQSRYLD